MTSVHSLLGLCALIVITWALSENRRLVQPRIILVGIGLQILIALVVLRVPVVKAAFVAMSNGVNALQAATEQGTTLVFGFLGGGPLPFEESQPGASFVLAFRSLPLIIVVSALTALLTYWRILPLVVRGFSLLLERTLGLNGAVGLGTAANIFVGMVEGPIFVRDYLGRMTRAELFVLMTAGMATIAGTVMVLYATIIGPVVPDGFSQLLIASIISAPAAVTVALVMVPETEASADRAVETATIAPGATSAMDAITRGTKSGLDIYLVVVATLIVLVSLVHLVNASLGLLPAVGGAGLSMERILGWIMAPVTWLMGVSWSEAFAAGSLMGTKTVLNELLAYLQMAQLPAGTLSPRSTLIMTYALCGFANFGSLGIMLGGLSAVVPERREDIVSLGLKSIVAGTLATCCTGAVIGIFV